MIGGKLLTHLVFFLPQLIILSQSLELQRTLFNCVLDISTLMSLRLIKLTCLKPKTPNLFPSVAFHITFNGTLPFYSLFFSLLKVEQQD